MTIPDGSDSVHGLEQRDSGNGLRGFGDREILLLQAEHRVTEPVFARNVDDHVRKITRIDFFNLNEHTGIEIRNLGDDEHLVEIVVACIEVSSGSSRNIEKLLSLAPEIGENFPLFIIEIEFADSRGRSKRLGIRYIESASSDKRHALGALEKALAEGFDIVSARIEYVYPFRYAVRNEHLIAVDANSRETGQASVALGFFPEREREIAVGIICSPVYCRNP